MKDYFYFEGSIFRKQHLSRVVLSYILRRRNALTMFVVLLYLTFCYQKHSVWKLLQNVSWGYLGHLRISKSENWLLILLRHFLENFQTLCKKCTSKSWTNVEVPMKITQLESPAGQTTGSHLCSFVSWGLSFSQSCRSVAINSSFPCIIGTPFYWCQSTHFHSLGSNAVLSGNLEYRMPQSFWDAL